MKNSRFLNKLIKEGKLELVEASDEISLSYEKKSKECKEVAKLAYNAGYHESAVSQIYYSIYNSVLSLFFKVGIKCENHSAAVILLKDLFSLNKLHLIFKNAKEERIDKQYYVTPTQDNILSKETCKELIDISLEFIVEINSFKNNLKLEDIERLRQDFKKRVSNYFC